MALIAIGIIAFLVFQPKQVAPQQVRPDLDDRASLPGTYYPALGNLHLTQGQVFDNYNSNPPTSGPHDPVPVNWGIYDEPQLKEKLVHSMEHAGVVIWYNCPDCEDLINNLKGVAQGYLNQGRRIVMTPYSDMDTGIAITSWTRLDRMTDFDEVRIQRFIEAHEGRYNPEGFPPGIPRP